jgi:aminomethyltransferase
MTNGNIQVRNTAFTNFHHESGARMVTYAGYMMPLEYTGIIDEHLTVRNKVGVFDISHMGEFTVSGASALDFLQYITSNDVSTLVDGKVQYSCLPNGRGGIVDDILVYRYNAEKYMLVVNAVNIEKDWQWCVTHAERFGIRPGNGIVNESDEIARLAVQGPLALPAVQKLTDFKVTGMANYTFSEIEMAGVKGVLLSTTGYTGSGGCEINVRRKQGPKLWNAVFEAGRDMGIKPAGLGARDTLRLEMGYCLYGNDIDDQTSPIEAGLGWITKFTGNKEFIDKSLLLEQKNEGTRRKLRGFVMTDRGIPRQHHEVLDDHGNIIGKVTSGTMSPMLRQGIGLAYLDNGYQEPGTGIFIKVRNNLLRAEVVKTPFYKKDDTR